jgi:hypothetical protein
LGLFKKKSFGEWQMSKESIIDMDLWRGTFMGDKGS